MTRIRPSDIDTSKHFWDTFGHLETEVSARYIVRFCQERGSWRAFTFRQINKFYQRSRKTIHGQDFSFNRLVHATHVRQFGGSYTVHGGGWVHLNDNGRYHLTPGFIERCFAATKRKAA